jgi:hypothetical protein
VCNHSSNYITQQWKTFATSATSFNLSTTKKKSLKSPYQKLTALWKLKLVDLSAFHLSLLDFFSNRVFIFYRQEGDSCNAMVKRKSDLKLRVQHACESMEISMARLEVSSKEIQDCDTALIIPKV